MIPSISCFEIINIVIPDRKISLCIPVSAADAAAVNPNVINILYVNDSSKFFIKGKPVFFAMVQQATYKSSQLH